jgi:hypothetical protein
MYARIVKNFERKEARCNQAFAGWSQQAKIAVLSSVS